MRLFLEKLKATKTKANKTKAKRWLYVPYDQLHNAHYALDKNTGIVLIESLHKAKRRPYHKQKLAFILTNMRHFALEQKAKGRPLHYIATQTNYADALRDFAENKSGGDPIYVARAAERELRAELNPLVREGVIEEIENEAWLTTSEEFLKATGATRPYKNDAFYRAVRKRTGLLMQDGKPEGGKWSYDAENRKKWPGTPETPTLPALKSDDITKEVIAFVNDTFADYPGHIDEGTLVATQKQADDWWQWALTKALPHFGPYEDAMHSVEKTLFHTRVSALLNIGRLSPQKLIDDVATSALPLACREGFIRQIIGWREYVRHIHEQTDGFRTLTKKRSKSTDAGYAKYNKNAGTFEGGDEGAAPNYLNAKTKLLDVFWGESSGLSCLDHVVKDVIDEGYVHHIPRLMVLSNIAQLLDIDPRALTDWFWVMFFDAYDWVVEPNVLGMGTFSIKTTMVTKPYIAGANYIHKMSNYCKGCDFHPKNTCPLTPLYWNFLETHEEQLLGNHRMATALAAMRKRSDEKREFHRRVSKKTLKVLQAGERLRPEDLE